MPLTITQKRQFPFTPPYQKGHCRWAYLCAKQSAGVSWEYKHQNCKNLSVCLDTSWRSLSPWNIALPLSFSIYKILLIMLLKVGVIPETPLVYECHWSEDRFAKRSIHRKETWMEVPDPASEAVWCCGKGTVFTKRLGSASNFLRLHVICINSEKCLCALMLPSVKWSIPIR